MFKRSRYDFNKRHLLGAFRGWGWQDFTAPVGAGPITLSDNENGIYGLFDGDNVIAGTAVIVTAADVSRKPYTGTTKMFSTMVTATNTTATTVVLSGTPNASWGTLRIYYLYDYKYGMPADYEIPSRHISESLWDEIGDTFIRYSSYAASTYTLDTDSITLTAGMFTARTQGTPALTLEYGAGVKTEFRTTAAGGLAIVTSGGIINHDGANLTNTGTIASGPIGVTSEGGIQLELRYDETYYTYFQTDSTGNHSITPSGGNLYVNSSILTVLNDSGGNHLVLEHSTGDTTEFITSSGGNLTITPSGGGVTIAGTLGSGAITATGNVTIDVLGSTDAILTMDGTSSQPGTLRYESDNQLFILDKNVYIDADAFTLRGGFGGGGYAETKGFFLGDGDTGFYEAADDTMYYIIGGSSKWKYSGNLFQGIRADMRIEAGSSAYGAAITVPRFSFYSDANTGIGTHVADGVNIIGNATQLASFDTTSIELKKPTNIGDGTNETQFSATGVQKQVSAGGGITQTFSGTKTLVDNSATGFVEIAVGTGELVGGEIFYTMYIDDGTDLQAHTGEAGFVAVNKAGTVTSDCQETYLNPSSIKVVTAGTLTDTLSCTDGAGKITLNFNANTSLDVTITLKYTIRMHSTNVITAL